MIIAMVLEENERIVPIVEGKIVRFYDTESAQYEDIENPASLLKEGRRGATLKLVIEKGATTFVSPPETFCDLSYQKAKQEGIQFYHILTGLSFFEFEQLIKKAELRTESELPKEEIVPSIVSK